MVLLGGRWSRGAVTSLPLVLVALSSSPALAVLPDCSEASIRAGAPPDAQAMLDRAYDWIHRGVMYCQCVTGAGGPYRTDCSGFVSMAWQLPGPGHTTYSFAGGPWDDHVSRIISRGELLPGDAYNYPGSPSAGTGHVVLFGGWLDAAHTLFCSLEESHSGTPARVIVRSVDPAYLPIRLASRASCVPHCEGSTIVSADCGRGDCGAYGAGCVTDGLGTRCVFSFCPAVGDADICLDTARIAHCHDGALSAPGDCSVYGSHCVSDSLGSRCVFAACSATGESDVCLSDSLIAHCSNGALSAPGDCSAYAAYCSNAAATNAHCVSAFCAPDRNAPPVAHDGCWVQNGDLLHCDATGVPTLEPCPAGQQCTVAGGAGEPHCAAATCPPTGEVDTCASDTEVGHCFGGSTHSVSDCAKSGGRCSTAGGAAHCTTGLCAGMDGLTGPAHDVCTPDGLLGHCDDTGVLVGAEACPGSDTCQLAGTSARCAPDAGVVSPSDGGADGGGDAGVGPAPASGCGCAAIEPVGLGLAAWLLATARRRAGTARARPRR